MIKFENAERFEIPGRGLLFAVSNPTEHVRDTNPFLGTVVMINGDKYFVRGVETFAVPIIRVGKPIGLLVKPYTEGEQK